MSTFSTGGSLDIDDDGDLDFYISGMRQEANPPGSTFFDYLFVYENEGTGFETASNQY